MKEQLSTYPPNQDTSSQNADEELAPSTAPEPEETTSDQSGTVESNDNSDISQPPQPSSEVTEETTEVEVSNHQWPSDALAGWVNSGRNLDEDDPESQEWLKNTVNLLQGFDGAAR